MAYSELIKSFSRIRDYMREFYVYGFKSREEYKQRSARSYDDERRRMESWLGEYMQFRQTPDGKNVFFSIDSRVSRNNPLYKAWKTKSFTDGDITLHFILLDILSDPEICLSFREITEKMDQYLSESGSARVFDESTVRKKLKEYVLEGILLTEKQGKTVFYRRTETAALPDIDILNFFSEAAPCGVIGSFLLDKTDDSQGHFAFKHHYITGTLDSEILRVLFSAIHEKRYILIENYNRRKETTTEMELVPLKIYSSVQSGRQYLMAYAPHFDRISSYRTDHILSVKLGELCPEYDTHLEILTHMQPNIWGVSTQGSSRERLEHVEFTVSYSNTESHIPRRLEREKRCGTVEYLDANHAKFSADVFDAAELVPWIRSFLCRITKLSISNKKLEAQFRQDMEDMYALYGLKGGDET